MMGFIPTIVEVDYSGINQSVKDMAEEDQKYCISKCLAKLLQNDCLVMRLFYLESQTLKEIIAFSVTFLKTILHRARKGFHIFI